MKRPVKVPSNAKYDKESNLWIVYSQATLEDGLLYDIEHCYNANGVLIAIVELEV